MADEQVLPGTKCPLGEWLDLRPTPVVAEEQCLGEDGVHNNVAWLMHRFSPRAK